MKTRRSNEENRKIYSMLKKRGIDTYLCQRLRHWTQNHINLFLKTHGYKPIKMKLTPIHRGKNDI